MAALPVQLDLFCSLLICSQSKSYKLPIASPELSTRAASAHQGAYEPGGRLLVLGAPADPWRGTASSQKEVINAGRGTVPKASSGDYQGSNPSARSIAQSSSWNSEPCNVSGLLSALFRYSRIAWTNSAKASWRSRSAFRTPSFTSLPSRSIVFPAGGGSYAWRVFQDPADLLQVIPSAFA